MSDVYVDGVPMGDYVRSVLNERIKSSGGSTGHSFWASEMLRPPARPASAMRDVVQHEFSGLRMVNHLKFLTSRFPLDVRAEYWHALTGRWMPLREQTGEITSLDPAFDISEQREQWEGPPVSFSIRDSHPPVIDRNAAISSGVHPLHFGSRHWVPVRWRTTPVVTKAIRLIFTRPGQGVESEGGRFPRDTGGRLATYSVAVKDLQIGYRIDSARDMPETGLLEEYATSTDLMGSRVTYSLKKDLPEYATGRVEGRFWRSEPQPVNYAVVNFYADVRDAEGGAQVIDRFYIDPLTVGPVLNLYYTNDEPGGDFEPSESRLTYPVVQTYGKPLHVERNHRTNAPEAVRFDEAEPSWAEIDNAYLQWRTDEPWWIGMSLRMLADDGTHPWLAWSGNTLRQNGRDIEFVTAGGQSLKIALPEEITAARNAEVRVVVSWTPAEGRFSHGNSLTLKVEAAGGRSSETFQIGHGDLGERPSSLYLGRYSTGTIPGDPAMALRAMVLKVEEGQPGYTDGFLSNPDLFILKEEIGGKSDFVKNALLRMHPRNAHEDFPAGLVGGPGDRFDDVRWTPVSRDYILRQGFLRFPARRARYFKFEFTNLVMENYDSLIPISRQVRLFPVDLIGVHHPPLTNPDPQRPPNVNPVEPPVPFSYSIQAPGVETMMVTNDVGKYESAVSALAGRYVLPGEDRELQTEGYVATDPNMAQVLSERGWIWSFTPWHVGTAAPRWHMEQTHRYEVVSVEHKTKIGFFVGLRKVEAYRVDYLTDDDTDIYHESFYDDQNIAHVRAMEFDGEKVRSIASKGEVISKTFPSVREVRAVQFASIQTDNIALLPDDGFVSDAPEDHWSVYGDSTLRRHVGEGIAVHRGVIERGYRDLDGKTYAELEEMTYAEIEVIAGEGMAGGGIQSEPVSATPSGRVYAALRITAQSEMAGPIRLEIVSVERSTVLAAVERHLTAGETAVLHVGYNQGSATFSTTYGELEATYGTYGEMQNHRYVDFESDPIGGPIFVRAYQRNPSRDRFMVERLSIFDVPVVWRFSVNGGETWHDSMDVRNDREAVLSFPEPGKELRWRANVYHRNSEVSALVVRPWYGGLVGSLPRSATDFVGPNRSVLDDYPDTDDDPMWEQSHSIIPGWWHTRDVANPYSGAPGRPDAGTDKPPVPEAPPNRIDDGIIIPPPRFGLPVELD